MPRWHTCRAYVQELQEAGFTTVRSNSDTLPAFMKMDVPLPRVTRVWRQIGMPGSYRPQVRWEPPGDQYLFAHTRP